MNTIKELLNIKYPMLQGPMANITNGAFAATISNLGIIGNIASASMNAEKLEEEIKIAQNITDRAFAVNIMLMNPHCDDLVDIIVKYGVKVVTTGAGNPEKYMSKLKEAGVIVIPVIPSVALAKRMERYGADAIVAEGTEAGGHIGELTTMSLIPQVVEAVNIPVIAAGGIATGRQVAAAFSLGASGVQTGTAFLVSEECPIHENYKNALIKAKDTDTIVTGRIAKGAAPVRIIKNQMAREFVKLEKEGKTMEELEHFTLGALRKSAVDGDVVNGSVMAGQVAGMLTEIRPAKDIIESIFNEAKAVLNEMRSLEF